MAAYESHDFYCLNCGKKSIPLSRKVGHQHSKNHRKKLYCPFCKTTVNHIEVRNYDEKEDFLEKFANGEFAEEAKESIADCADNTLWSLFNEDFKSSRRR